MAMVVLPDPPADLVAAPRDFYEALRAAVAELRPTDVDAANAEIDFGDGGVAVTLPHEREQDWTLAAQVGKATGVVFAGPMTRHFGPPDGPDWPAQAAALLAGAMAGDIAVEVSSRGDRVVRVGEERVLGLASLAVWRPVRTELVRVDFGGRPPEGAA